MEQVERVNGGTQVMPQPHKKQRLIPFDQNQRATIQKAYMQWMQVCSTVASCMGIGLAQLNQDMTGFLVEEE